MHICTVYVCAYILYVAMYVRSYAFMSVYVCMYVYRYLCVYITPTPMIYLKVLLEYWEWTVSVEGRRSTIRWPKCWECTCHITGELADVTNMSVYRWFILSSLQGQLCPFLIDPSQRATEWLKVHLKESRLEVINQQVRILTCIYLHTNK